MVRTEGSGRASLLKITTDLDGGARPQGGNGFVTSRKIQGAEISMKVADRFFRQTQGPEEGKKKKEKRGGPRNESQKKKFFTKSSGRGVESYAKGKL